MINKQNKEFDFNKSLDKMSKSVSLMIWIGVIVGIVGLVLIASENWLIALGVFLALWGYNLEQRGKTAKMELKKVQMQEQLMNSFGNLFGNKE